MSLVMSTDTLLQIECIFYVLMVMLFAGFRTTCAWCADSIAKPAKNCVGMRQTVHSKDAVLNNSTNTLTHLHSDKLETPDTQRQSSESLTFVTPLLRQLALPASTCSQVKHVTSYKYQIMIAILSSSSWSSFRLVKRQQRTLAAMALLVAALLLAAATATTASARVPLSRTNWMSLDVSSTGDEDAKWNADDLVRVQQQEQQPHPVSPSAARKGSCLTFLVGIGTQKGGTTAAWAYISHHAHPRLRVSAEKEVGFWDQLHGWHKGCTLGDYLMLLNGTAEDPSSNPDTPGLCPAPQPPILAAGGAAPAAAAVSLPTAQAAAAVSLRTAPAAAAGGTTSRAGDTAASRKRLRSSSLCGVRAELLRDAAEREERALHVSGGIAGSASSSDSGAATATLLSECEAQARRPWWWLWGGWSGCRLANTAVFGHDGALSSTLSASSDRHGGDGGYAGQINEGSGAAAGVVADTQSTGTEADDIESLLLEPLVHVDITPSYLYDPMAPLWVRALLPEARVLVILREPVSRAISNFNMRWQKRHQRDQSGHGGTTSESGADDEAAAALAARTAAWTAELRANVSAQVAALSRCTTVAASYGGHVSVGGDGSSADTSSISGGALLGPELGACLGLASPYHPGYQASLFAHGMVWQGVYADGLERWLSLFPASQVMVWVSEDFKADPAAHMRQLVAWLGLDADGLAPKLRPGAPLLRPVHVREYEAQPPPDVSGALRAFYEPHNERLFQLLARKGYGHVVERMRIAWAANTGTAHQDESGFGWSLAAPAVDLPL